MTYEIAIKLDPSKLLNPDLDIRYALPELLNEKSKGSIEDNGYDYEPDGNALIIFLKASELQSALAAILDVIKNEKVCENDLIGAVVAVKQDDSFKVIYPDGYEGTFAVRTD
jgi:hypothetical protein